MYYKIYGFRTVKVAQTNKTRKNVDVNYIVVSYDYCMINYVFII